MNPTLTTRITTASEISGAFLMPYLREDSERCNELQRIGASLRLSTKVIRPQNLKERYASVMFERVEQPSLL